jgi:uncharacterized protein (DUF2235 family)
MRRQPRGAPQEADVPKKIVLLSDGTGNSSAKLFKTNVWRVYQALDLQDAEVRAIYDDGVGTDHFAPIALLGGAVGFGLAQNIRDLYGFLCRNYQAGDEIYAFGFSRGAFTIRALVGMITSVGLVQASSEEELTQRVAQAYREHRKNFKTNWVQWYEQLRAAAMPSFERSKPKPLGPVPELRFLGLWDTVAAYGLPIDELQRGIDRYFRAHSFPDRELSPRVMCARHALALDDERRTFHPMLWSEQGERDPERIQQVWFAGVHSDVGGGYPKEALSYVPLVWIMREAERAGLRFKAGAISDFAAQADAHGELHDSRSGFAAYYRYAPRRVMTLSHDDFEKVQIARPKIHESVFARIQDGRVAYSPLGIPAEYDIVRADGTLAAGPAKADPKREPVFESLAQARVRAGLDDESAVVDRAWDYVWYRRVLYFVTLGASLFLVAFPKLFDATPDSCQGPLCVVGTHLLRPLGGFLPSWLQKWIEAFSEHPGWSLCGIVAVALSMWLSGRVEARIEASSENAWQHVKQGPEKPAAYRRGLVFHLRSSQLLVGPYLWLARSVIPSAFAIVLGLATLLTANHALFASASALEYECSTSAWTVVGDQAMTAVVKLQNPCNATKLRLQRGATYSVQLEWKEATAVGFSNLLATPLRRLLGKPWGAPIMKLGAELEPLDVASSQLVTAKSDADVYVFANDAVVAFPWLWSSFYADNQGEATLRIARVRDTSSESADTAVLTSAGH